MNVTTCQIHDEPRKKCAAKTEVTATANACIKTQQAQKMQATAQKGGQDDQKVTKSKAPSSHTDVFITASKSSSDEVAKHKSATPSTLSVFSPRNRSSSKRSSFHTLDVSALNTEDPHSLSSTELERPKLGAIYRKRSKSFEEEDVSLKVIIKTSKKYHPKCPK